MPGCSGTGMSIRPSSSALSFRNGPVSGMKITSRPLAGICRAPWDRCTVSLSPAGTVLGRLSWMAWPRTKIPSTLDCAAMYLSKDGLP